MILQYTEGLRVVIHTANLVAKDWDQKTQGYKEDSHVTPIINPYAPPTKGVA